MSASILEIQVVPAGDGLTCALTVRLPQMPPPATDAARRLVEKHFAAGPDIDEVREYLAAVAKIRAAEQEVQRERLNLEGIDVERRKAMANIADGAKLAVKLAELDRQEKKAAARVQDLETGLAAMRPLAAQARRPVEDLFRGCGPLARQAAMLEAGARREAARAALGAALGAALLEFVEAEDVHRLTTLGYGVDQVVNARLAAATRLPDAP